MRTRLALAALLAAACSDGCPVRGCDNQAQTDTAADVPSGAASTNPLCVAAQDVPPAVQLMAATYGDVVVMRGLGGELAASEAATKAKALGAVDAYDVHIAQGIARAGDRLVLRTIVGLPAAGHKRLAPQIASGRAPQSPREAVLSIADAEALGAKLGDSLDVATFDDLDDLSPAVSLTVVGLIDTREAIWVGTASSSVWTAVDLVPPHAISTAVFGKAASERQSLAERLRKELADAAVLTAEQLQEPVRQMHETALTFCDHAKAGESSEAPLHLPAWRCAQLEGWDEGAAEAAKLWGDALLWRTPGTNGDIAAGAPLPDGVRIDPFTAMTGALFDHAHAFVVPVYGWRGDALSGLAPWVAEGSLDEITAAGGIAISLEMSRALGVALGDEVDLALGQSVPPEAPFRPEVARARIAAVLKFPRHLGDGASLGVWLHGDHATAKKIGGNAARAWGSHIAMADFVSATPGVEIDPNTELDGESQARIVAGLRHFCGP